MVGRVSLGDAHIMHRADECMVYNAPDEPKRGRWGDHCMAPQGHKKEAQRTSPANARHADVDEDRTELAILAYAQFSCCPRLKVYWLSSLQH